MSTSLPGSEPNGTASAADKAKKGVWEIILTTTPVFFTIVATFLAGQSTGEMTRAQYHRSLAGQNQSKVGDQWAFFQAKRGRGTTLQMTAELLEALKEPAGFEPESLPRAAQQLALDLNKAQEQAARLNAAIDQAKAGLGKNLAGLLESEGERLFQRTKAAAADAGRNLQEINAILNPADAPIMRERVQAVFAALQPEARSGKKSTSFRFDGLEGSAIATLDEAINAIISRAPERTVATLVLSINPDTLVQAIETNEARAQAEAAQSKAIDNVISEIEKRVNRQVRIARSFAQGCRDLQLVLNRAEEKEKIPETILRTARGLERRSQAIQTQASDLNAGFKGARLAANARRYERDARDNQDLAYLYEIKVYAASAQADRHLLRSKNFFFGMLAAQVAVTVATLALAVRYKSLLWGLATVAGLGAIAFGAYMLLDLG